MICRSASLLALGLSLAGSLLLASPVQAAKRIDEIDEVLDQSQDAMPSPRFLPSPVELAKSGQQELLKAIVAKLANPNERENLLPLLDQSLAGLREPTTLRGMVQFLRCQILLRNQRVPEALDAIEESIRLLPEYSGPLLVAAGTYAYSNQVAKGAEFFLRAAELDPETVRKVDDYEVNNLMRRLKIDRDERRAAALSNRLLEIGWVGSSLDSRSNLARTAIEQRIESGDVQGAKALISKLLVPGHSFGLLIDRRYSAIWPDLEAWSGPALRTQWGTYLREARGRWAPTQEPVAVRGYLAALRSAGHHRTIVRDILPRLYAKVDPIADTELQFVVAGLADALAIEGRWGEVDKLFEHAQGIWPLRAENPNALNIAGNRGRYLLLADKAEESLEAIDEAIMLAVKWQVNPDAIASMQNYRACALHQLGKDSEAALARATSAAISFASESAYVALCIGDRDAARRAILEGLRSEAGRANALAFMQKDTSEPVASDYGRRMRAAVLELRSDPVLLAEVAKYGRILPYSEAEGAPPE